MNQTLEDNALHLPKSLYELLPYAYLLLGAMLIIGLNSPVAYASGALLYMAGAAVWVVRSSHRRKNSNNKIQNRRGLVVFPEKLYEFLPFAYMGLGIVLATVFSHPIAYLSAFVLGFAGALVWLIRAIYRTQSSQEAMS